MEKQRDNKEEVIKSVKKIITTKSIVSSYIKGKTSYRTVIKKGVKFAKPL